MEFAFLGFVVFGQFEDSLPQFSSPYDRWLPSLVSLDPLERLRAAWFLPGFGVKGETLTVDAGRAEDARYLLDGVPLWDPQTGGNVVLLPRTLMEQGSLIYDQTSLAPVVALTSRAYEPGWHAGVSGSNPFFIPDGKQGDAEVFFAIPLGQRASVSLDGAALMRDDRPAANLTLSHRGTAAYTGAVTGELVPSEGMLVRARFLRFQGQRDFFTPAWVFNPASAPSSFTAVNLLTFNYSYKTDILDLVMTLSGYNSFLADGGRKDEDLNLFLWVPQGDSSGSPAAQDFNNPFGVKGLFYSQGFNPRLVSRNSTADRALVSAGVFAGDMHEVRMRFAYTSFNLFAEITDWQGNLKQVLNTRFTPRLTELYLGDRIHLERLWLEPGAGFLYVEVETSDTSESGADSTTGAMAIEPRVETHFYSKPILLTAGSELAAATAPYSFFFDTQELYPIEDSLVLISRTFPAPERAWRTWCNARLDWAGGWSAGATLFSRVGFRLLSGGMNAAQDSLDTIPTAGVFMEGTGVSVGIQSWVGYTSRWVSANLSYRFSQGKATSAGVYSDYSRLLEGDSSSDTRSLPLDSPHKFTLETRFSTPSEMHFLLRDWFAEPRFALASGFPDERDASGSLPWWAWCEIAAGRMVRIGGFNAQLRVELLNPFGWKKPIFGQLAASSLPTEDDFPERVMLGDADYRSSRDANHDGYITAQEEVEAYARARAFYDAWSQSPLPARTLNIKFSISF